MPQADGTPRARFARKPGRVPRAGKGCVRILCTTGDSARATRRSGGDGQLPEG